MYTYVQQVTLIFEERLYWYWTECDHIYL